MLPITSTSLQWSPRLFPKGSRRQRHRGVAMLLVLISLMMATVLTTSYLASRDNSAAIGENSASAASARWAADAGLQIGLAILETETEWRMLHNSGRLFENLSLAGGKATVELIDLETGGTPGPTTENVQLTSYGAVNGLRQEAMATAYVPLTATPPADVDLSEFAVFVKRRLEMRNRSTITRWSKAPLGKGGRLALGTQATGSGSIILLDSAAAIDTTVYAGPSASSSLISSATSILDLVTLLDQVPFPAPPSPNVAAPLIGTSDLTMDGGTTTETTNQRRKQVTLKNNAVRTLQGDLTFIADTDLTIESGSKLIVDGNVKIVVFGNLAIDDAAIELMPNSRLALYVRGDDLSPAFDIDDGYIGDLRADNTRDATGNGPWMNPQRIMLYSMAPSGSDVEWLMQNNSVIKGSIYIPHADELHVQNQSAIYGSVAVQELEMQDDAAIFYDPGLDSHSGYTNLYSSIYDAGGNIDSAILTGLTSLDNTVLDTVAIVLGVEVEAFDKITSVIADLGTTATAVNQPTPRPIQIDYTIVSLGQPVRAWEAQ